MLKTRISVLKMFRDKPLLNFSIIAFLYCVLMGLLFQPITRQSQGDAGAYIELAKQFLNISDTHIDLSGRQPLYSLFLAIFIIIFGKDGFIYPVMYFQFFLIFISSILVYKIFGKFKTSRLLPWFAGLAYLFNFSTLYYGYNLLSETISLFIFISIVYLMLVSIGNNNIRIIILLGIMNGFMVLARFNAIGIPIITFFCLALNHYRNFRLSQAREFFKVAAFYLVPIMLILNFWCVYNSFNRGFYGLFPSYHAGQRWAIPATINENNSVSEEYKPLLDIFINAKNEYLKSNTPKEKKKGSLLDNDLLSYIYYAITPKINGYKVYQLAEKDILLHFNLNNKSEDIAKIGILLKPFYNEIQKQNTTQILQYRIYSFINSFRASATTLPVKEKINLNIFPGSVFKVYKVLFMVIALLTYMLTGIYLMTKIWKFKKSADLQLLFVSLFIWYFPLVHFYANVLGDANRFKFPTEPLIFGLMFFYVLKMLNWLQIKKNNTIQMKKTF